MWPKVGGDAEHSDSGAQALGRAGSNHALNSREPHPDLLERSDPLHDLASLLEKLSGRGMERANVLVKGLQRLQRSLLPLVVTPNRGDEAFRDRAAGDPRLAGVLVSDRKWERDGPRLASLPARPGLLGVLGDELAKVGPEVGVSGEAALDVVELVGAQGRQ